MSQTITYSHDRVDRGGKALFFRGGQVFRCHSPCSYGPVYESVFECNHGQDFALPVINLGNLKVVGLSLWKIGEGGGMAYPSPLEKFKI